MIAVGDVAKTQARPDRHGPSGPREIDAGWMGAHAPITNLERSCWRANPLMRRQLVPNCVLALTIFVFTIPDGRSGRTYLGRDRYPAGSKPADNLAVPRKKILSD
jgi:hypothetical protein